jgi:hypothetical protein
MDHNCKLCEGISPKKLKEHEDRCLKEHGFYAHFVMDDPSSPTGVNYHTHGLTKTYNHPDIQVVASIQPEIAHALTHNTVELIKKGTVLEVGKKYRGIIENLQIVFIYAMEGHRDVLRLILPDSSGESDKDKICEPFSEQYQNTGIILN